MSSFRWEDFYDVGCEELEKGDEKYLRTAIDRFYFACFCQIRDYLIDNKIFYNKKYKKMLKSKSPKVHYATQYILKHENRKINGKIGKKIVKEMVRLRKSRNEVNYESNLSFNLKEKGTESRQSAENIFDSIGRL